MSSAAQIVQMMRRCTDTFFSHLLTYLLTYLLTCTYFWSFSFTQFVVRIGTYFTYNAAQTMVEFLRIFATNSLFYLGADSLIMPKILSQNCTKN